MLHNKLIFRSTRTLMWDLYIIIIINLDDDDYALFYGYDKWVHYIVVS